MQLRILKSQAISFSLNKLENIKETDDTKRLKLQNIARYDDTDDTVFSIIFDIEIVHPNEFVLKCQFVTWFKTTEAITEQFKSSPFIKVNAPAIAYPFLRSMIATMTLNAGYSPVMLPSVNFVELNKE